jgi:glucosyl-3-phosphoglycerate phosphatase
MELILVRHGESAANVLAEEAERSGAQRIAVPARDADVELSDRGRRQAEDLGRALAAEPPPDAVWVSPYRRAVSTAETALATAGWGARPRADDRLRDRELGILDALTARGVRELHPDEDARRRFLGKYYYRPPGGESWTDVALRVRSVLPELARSGDRVLVVAHDAVIWLFRAVCEGMGERALLEEAAGHPIHNASVTRLVRDRPEEPWRVALFDDIRHLDEATEHGGRSDVPHG